MKRKFELTVEPQAGVSKRPRLGIATKFRPRKETKQKSLRRSSQEGSDDEIQQFLKRKTEYIQKLAHEFNTACADIKAAPLSSGAGGTVWKDVPSQGEITKLSNIDALLKLAQSPQDVEALI